MHRIETKGRNQTETIGISPTETIGINTTETISAVSQRHRSLDISDVLRQRKIFIVNLEYNHPLRPADVQLLGKFILNDIIAHVSNRPEGERSPVHLIMDEADLNGGHSNPTRKKGE